jgi:hypothetical protein
MILTEKDIDFAAIDWKQFEELCFDMLVNFKYHSLVWRQGGHDKGRDIEACFKVKDTIVEPYHEKWFVECKHHQGGITINDLSEKIDWARSERPSHFLLMTNSHLTQGTREWLSKQEKKLDFKIHLLEGKQIKRLLLQIPDLAIKYFYDEGKSKVKEMLKLWVLYDILPDAKTIYKIFAGVQASKLTTEELAFLLFTFNVLHEQIELDCSEDETDMVTDKLIVSELANRPNCKYPVFSSSERENLHLAMVHGITRISRKDSDYKIFYYEMPFKGKYCLEVLMHRENKKLKVKVALGLLKKK